MKAAASGCAIHVKLASKKKKGPEHGAIEKPTAK